MNKPLDILSLRYSYYLFKLSRGLTIINYEIHTNINELNKHTLSVAHHLAPDYAPGDDTVYDLRSCGHPKSSAADRAAITTVTPVTAADGTAGQRATS